jgi:hypothetical protein
MKPIFLCLTSLIVSMGIAINVYAICIPTYTQHTLIDTGCKPDYTIQKGERNYIRFGDGFLDHQDTEGSVVVLPDISVTRLLKLQRCLNISTPAEI